MIKVPIKPLSFNLAWRAVPTKNPKVSKNIKSREYRQYEKDVLWFLSPIKGVDFTLPLYVVYVFHLSSPMADWDNFIKAFQDIISAKYGFNDCKIIAGLVLKTKERKGHESSEFLITNSFEEAMETIRSCHRIHCAVVTETVMK